MEGHDAAHVLDLIYPSGPVSYSFEEMLHVLVFF